MCSDYPECYELVLRKASTEFSWSKVAQKALVMIGDAPPHEVNENPGRIDWREEVKTLAANSTSAGRYRPWLQRDDR